MGQSHCHIAVESMCWICLVIESWAQRTMFALAKRTFGLALHYISGSVFELLWVLWQISMVLICLCFVSMLFVLHLA